jgi:hypothetical protein
MLVGALNLILPDCDPPPAELGMPPPALPICPGRGELSLPFDSMIE